MRDVPALVDHLFRRQAGQLVATLTRRLGPRHLSLAEDAVQDALITALQQWPFRGVPDRPAAWLFQVARNRALDRLRQLRIAGASGASGASGAACAEEALLRNELPGVDDDELALLFMACHPELPAESRVALALKVACGFSVPEIARALLAQERAIAQRLVRAKRTLRDRDVDFGMPGPRELPARLDSVLEALYLMFNEGYAATSGEVVVREDVASEAMRLAALVTAHPATGTPRAWALRSLMCLHAARFPARAGSDGSLFLLRDQDRARWDRRLMGDGLRALDRAASGDEVSRCHLEAGIAACHAVAASWEATDWRQILAQYDRLWALTASPVVAVNRAVAVSRVHGPLAALAALDDVAALPPLEHYALLPAVQAELWREAGDPARAAEYHRAALARARLAPEQRWLASRL